MRHSCQGKRIERISSELLPAAFIDSYLFLMSSTASSRPSARPSAIQSACNSSAALHTLLPPVSLAEEPAEHRLMQLLEEYRKNLVRALACRLHRFIPVSHVIYSFSSFPNLLSISFPVPSVSSCFAPLNTVPYSFTSLGAMK